MGFRAGPIRAAKGSRWADEAICEENRKATGWVSMPPSVSGAVPALWVSVLAKKTPMIRRFGASPESGRQYRRRPGAYAVLLREGRILLTYQDGSEPEFQLPGGGIDPGEAPIFALHREVMEETGWTISSPRRVGTYRRFCFMPEYGFYAEKLCSVWIARPIMQMSAPTEPGHEAHWFPAGQAAAMLADPGAREMLTIALRYGGRRRRS